MKNLKIRSKLMLMVFVIALFAIIMSFVAIVSVNQASSRTETVFHTSVLPVESLGILTTEIMDMRRQVTLTIANFLAGETAALPGTLADLERQITLVQNAIDNHTERLQSANQLSDAFAEHIRSMQQINVLFGQYRDSVVIQIDAVGVGDIATIVAANTVNTQINAQMNALLDPMMEDSLRYATANYEYSQSARAASTMRVVVSLVFMLASGIVAAVVVGSSIMRPIRNVNSAVAQISKGNFAVNLDTARNDEIGVLSRDMNDLVGVVKSITDDLSKAHYEYIEAGNMHYTIDTAKYQNSYGEMIGLVNSLLTAVTTDIGEVANTLNYIADGDFSKSMNMEIWVGDWVVMPDAVNKLTTNLRSVRSEVNTMIAAISAKGDLSFRIDIDKYTMDWRYIMKGLNSIANSVNKPLRIIEIAMNEMEAGNFDVESIDSKIAAAGLDPNVNKYRGVFHQIIASFESSITSTSSYINEISKKLGDISQGNLTTSISREYLGSFKAIKDSLNNISSTLHRTMTEILSSADHVLSGSKEISTASSRLADGSSQQAASVEELNTSIETIRLLIKDNSQNAATADDLSKRSTQSAKSGNEAVEQMLEAMEQIKQSSTSISGINKVIQDIAFQTNLLALNASVEAARAGEHGKGFAVVADEVRTLAGRSQAAASETTQLIQDSISRVEAGSAIAQSTADALEVIVNNVSEVSQVIGNVSNSSVAQDEAAQTTTQGIIEIANVAQDNSASSQETAAAAMELTNQAEALRELVSFFKL